jgi:uncharacterized protein with von Willebrand factor type A (vWA) domain
MSAQVQTFPHRGRAHGSGLPAIWLNPLAGDPAYGPLLRAMDGVLPCLDYLLPADSLQSLKRVGRTLARLMTS